MQYYHSLQEYTVIGIFRDLPKLVALCFLSVSIPIRLGVVIRKRFKLMDDDTKPKTYNEKLDEIRKSRIGRHIAKNFIPPKPKIRA